jgi:AcrR family transcriptional regulator
MEEHARIVKKRRPYTLRSRAAAMDRTRDRITRAAIHLHATVGPAATTMSRVAALAGVTRATLYRHFPTEAALFTACSSAWLDANPRPDVTGWVRLTDPRARLRVGLGELYAWYQGTEAMRANLERDIDALPAPIREGILAFPPSVVETLAAGWPGPAGRLRRAAIVHAVAFETWRSLAHEGLEEAEIVGLMEGLVADVASADVASADVASADVASADVAS